MIRKNLLSASLLGVALAAMAVMGCERQDTERERTTPEKTMPGTPGERTTGAVPQEKPSTETATVEVKLKEHTIQMPTSVTAGEKTFKVTNTGTMEHNFKVEGEGIDKKLDTNVPPGTTKELTVNLKPGTYKVTCPLEDHEEQGMSIELKVVGNR
jgi:uncharacterized cupredoxin-like copper-binding protein